MKAWFNTTMPQHRKVLMISPTQRIIFSQVVSLLLPYATRLDTRVNTPEHYELWTRHNYRSLSMNPKNKRGVLFAGVMISQNKVGLYFFPLHIHPTLSEKIDDSIRPFWRGNSAFHFRESLAELTQLKLTELLENGWQYYQANHWIS